MKKREPEKDIEWYVSPNGKLYIKMSYNGDYLLGNIGGHDLENLGKNFKLVSRQIGDRNGKNVIEAMGWKPLKDKLPKRKIDDIEKMAINFYRDCKQDDDYPHAHAGEQFSEFIDSYIAGTISDEFINACVKEN